MTSPTAPRPPPAPGQGGRRGGGGGRGRGRGRERRAGAGAAPAGGDVAPAATAADRESGRRGGKRDKATDGKGGKRRGGGARASAAKPRAPRGRKGSAGGGGGGPALQRKVLVRNIPYAVTEEEVVVVLEGLGVGRELVWRFVGGKAHGKNRAPTPARVYLDMRRSAEQASALIAAMHGQPWPPAAAGRDAAPGEQQQQQQQQQPVLDVAFAPYQKVPREKLRKDAKAGTIDRDPEFLAFLEELSRPREKMPSADVAADSAEGEQAEKPVAALVKYLNERKTRDKSKGRSGKGDKNASRRQGTRKKEKGAGGKEKPKKERQKKKADASTGGQDSAKPRKTRGGKVAPGKKEAATKSEAPVEPGAVRIMAPKDPSSRSSAAAGTNTAAPATARARATCEAGQGDKKQARGQKGSVASGGGGRGRKDSRAAEGTAGLTEPNGNPTDNGKTTGPRPRRAGSSQSAKSASGGGPKADNKKRAFAPKADVSGAV